MDTQSAAPHSMPAYRPLGWCPLGKGGFGLQYLTGNEACSFDVCKSFVSHALDAGLKRLYDPAMITRIV